MNTENNKLIAEFMRLNINNRNPNTILYHSDWNWLMEVVQKIESIECEETSTDFVGYHLFDVEIRQNVCIIHGTDIEESACDKIDNVYYAVVQFIKWYNEQNK